MRFALLALLAVPTLVHAQGVADGRDSALVKANRADLDSIARDKTAPAYSKRAQARIRARDSVFVVTVPTPPPPPPDTTPTPPTPPDTTPTPPPPPVARFDGIAELPRIAPARVEPSCAVSVAVAQGMDLQAAINMAQPGACLLLAPGATFVGNFMLPNKGASTAWVTIRTNVSLTPGARMTPTWAAAVPLAKLLTPNNTSVLSVAAGASQYVLSGLEFGLAPSAEATPPSALVQLRNQGTQTRANVPTRIQVRQVYIHGTPTSNGPRRCIFADFAEGRIEDSWLDECHSNDSDSQAILMLAGMRGLVITNNTLYGGHEPVMSGGGDPADSTLQPSDLTLTRNVIGRPLAWKGRWQLKNALEFKDIRRALVEGNVIGPSWPDAQAGFCLNAKAENQSSTAPYSTSSDITLRYNLVRGCANGFVVNGRGTSGPVTEPASRYSIHDNRIDSVAQNGGSGIGLQLMGDGRDVQIARMTILNGLQGAASQSAMSFDAMGIQRLSVTGIIIGHGTYGVKGTGSADGTPTLTTYAPGAVFTGNAIVMPPNGSACPQYPAGTVCPAAVPSASAALGADEATLAQKTAGVVVPDPRTAARRAGRPRVPWRPSPDRCHEPLATCDVPLQP